MRLFWKSSRAKRVAISTISPLVESSRALVGKIHDQTWRQPYMIGFVSTLITLSALRAGKLDSEQIGLTQLEAWTAITGLHDDQIGEDIQLLCAKADEHFLVGCRNAGVFDKVYNAEPIIDPMHAFTTPPGQSELHHRAFGTNTHTSFSKGGEFAEALWGEFFNEHLNK